MRAFYDPRTCSVQYIVADLKTGACAIIDPVLDFDVKSGATDTHNADMILAYVDWAELDVVWILDTHPGSSSVRSKRAGYSTR